MWIFILIIVGAILIYNIGKNSGETIGQVSSEGGMRLKYSRLLNHILSGHKDCRILLETRTYIRAGVSNYGGSTTFHIQECPKNMVMIDYEISNNPTIPNFSLRFTFPDSMNQDEMMVQIGSAIQKKMMEINKPSI